ncbi:PREDICTED: uncharacterized protein LOC109463090 [Branchiostoma belcheri]|uniref:Uncharacterized protein LOC109463090 n=1 Tax=Branchiostoma belcheri TaxID=7741 RepID=A0A6P4Y977_BRABE|nr:PREDICTED: uncharacterized protein LOC109463090 [Branchiostoma belcheri]
MNAQRMQLGAPGGIPWDGEFLRKYRVELLSGITPTTLKQVLDTLLAKRDLIEEEVDLILNDGKTRKDKVRNLLDTLSSKGPGSIGRFKDALAEVDKPSSELVNTLDATEAASSLR